MRRWLKRSLFRLRLGGDDIGTELDGWNTHREEDEEGRRRRGRGGGGEGEGGRKGKGSDNSTFWGCGHERREKRTRDFEPTLSFAFAAFLG